MTSTLSPAYQLEGEHVIHPAMDLTLSCFGNRKKLVVGLKCSLILLAEMWIDTVQWMVFLMHNLFNNSISLCCSAGQAVSVFIYLGWKSKRAHKREQERDEARDCMQLQPLYSAAWPVAMATWLHIPFHLPFLINFHSCLSLCQPSIVLKCLSIAADLPPLFWRGLQQTKTLNYLCVLTHTEQITPQGNLV